jgi:hypothetical protein
VDYCALQVVERDLATENRVFVYTREETSFQRRCLNMVLDLLASPDARVRQVHSLHSIIGLFSNHSNFFIKNLIASQGCG